MVDIIKTSVQQSLSQTSLDARAQAKRKTIDAPVTQQVSGSSDVSILSSKAQVKDMAEKPPLDIEAVGRIKEAIANGTYPIDIYNPVLGQPRPALTRTTTWDKENLQTWAFFIQDQVALTERLKALAGVRFERFELPVELGLGCIGNDLRTVINRPCRARRHRCTGKRPPQHN